MSAHLHKGGKNTLAMTVSNTGFLVDRLGEDCHPLQHLRELTTNSIEAILRTSEKSGEIIWDVDWIHYDLESRYKLCITDNGIGMTGEEMERYINQLSSSASEQSLSTNYGVGGKIATATKNHAGVLYISWQNNKSAMVHLWRDPDSGQYGLKRFETGDGDVTFHTSVEDSVKPAMITTHGTKVVLIGNTDEQDTMKAPSADTPSPSRWIARYLNSRYFRIPKGIIIRAREGWENPREDKDRNLLRTVTGQEKYLADHSESSGVIELTGARAHWWILRDELALNSNSGFIESSGHVAALYGDELYELTNGRAGTSTLQNFGVIFGHKQVVIYVEPDGKQGQLTTNTARTMLLLNRQRLPWTEWAAEFRDNMPSEIENLIAAKAAGSSGADHSKSIRERLQQIIELFKLSRYKPAKDGPFRVAPSPGTGGLPRPETEPKVQAGKNPSGGTGGTAGSVYSAFQTDDGVPAKLVSGEVFPEPSWIYLKDGTRTAGDLEDRAARYLSDQNKLLINGDFRVFSDMTEKFIKDLGGNETLRSAVKDAVEQWFEQSLVETIIGIQALKNAREWNPQDINTALSEEALTAAVMPRYHVHNAVKRHLGSKLGKMA